MVTPSITDIFIFSAHKIKVVEYVTAKMKKSRTTVIRNRFSDAIYICMYLLHTVY